MISKEEQEKLNAELCKAADNGWFENVKDLVEYGAEINARNTENMTPLHYASWRGVLDVVSYLIEKGAKVNVQDNYGETPLHKAVRMAKYEVVKYLCEKGAEVDAKDNWDQTPLYLASLNKYWGQFEVLRYLFLEWNALMTILGMFNYSKIMKEKMGRETESQSILDYFLQNKSRYKPEELQQFKTEFLDFHMNEEDSKNLKSIVKFL